MQKYRKDGDMSYALGTELTLELLKRRPEDTTVVYVHSRQKDNEIYREVMELCRKNRIQVIFNDKAFNIVNAKENCYMMGVFRKFTDPVRKDTNHVVLVNPGNMGNLGTIIRTMVGFGIYDLAIITPGADIYDPKGIRASMRAFFSLRFSLYPGFEEYLSDVEERELFPFMLDGTTDLNNVEVPERYSLIFGNEGTGLPDEFHKVGTPVFIRQLDTIDSLNLDNAVSIGIYEFVRGRL